MNDFDMVFWRPVAIRIIAPDAPHKPDCHYYTSALGVVIEFSFTVKEINNADPAEHSSAIATD